ncbi:MAG: transposase [Tolypothrix carrinoi HA7290-LM1]|nr:transposase [Tolypothrix carrinoi HA7290-LM1]
MIVTAPQRVITIKTCTKPANGSENFFAKLKQYRAIATRYDKRANNFFGAIYLAASVIWLN